MMSCRTGGGTPLRKTKSTSTMWQRGYGVLDFKYRTSKGEVNEM